MSNKSSVNGIHSERLKAIRSYVNFDYDLRKPLSTYEKRKIKKYFDEIDALTNRPFQVYRPRKKENLKPAQELAQHEKRLPGLEVAFIPSSKPVKVRISKTGKASYKNENVRTIHIELSPKALATDLDKEVRRALREAGGANNFHILCGRYEIRTPVKPEFLKERLANLINRYSPGGSQYREGNHYQKWLHGLAANFFENQSTYEEYIVEKQKAAEKLKRQKRNARRRKKNAGNMGRRLRN